ncbi:MAG: hypothetical protein ABI239_11980 [Aquihabitans sp.]
MIGFPGPPLEAKLGGAQGAVDRSKATGTPDVRVGLDLDKHVGDLVLSTGRRDLGALPQAASILADHHDELGLTKPSLAIDAILTVDGWLGEEPGRGHLVVPLGGRGHLLWLAASTHRAGLRSRGPVGDPELAHVAVPDLDRVVVDHHNGLPADDHLTISVGPPEQGKRRADQAGPGHHFHPGRDLGTGRADGSRIDGNTMFGLW